MSNTSSIRRAARQRREYLYRKSLESQSTSTTDKKRQLISSEAKGAPVPTEIRNEYDDLKKSVDADDVRTEEGVKTIDDEYATLGLYDPRICVTTSREPSSRLKQFSKEVRERERERE